MNCEQIEKSLITYLEGKTAPGELRQVEAHLAACAACRERAEQFRLLWGVLEEVPSIAPSPAFDAAVRERIAREPHRAGPWKWLVLSPRMAFAMAAVLLSAWLWSQKPGRQAAVPTITQGSEAEFSMIQDLPMLEDYDVLANFDALSEVPVEQAGPQAHP